MHCSRFLNILFTCSILWLLGAPSSFGQTKAADFLTPEELQWLQTRSSLRVAVGRAFAPVMWMDDQEQFHGITADYLVLLEQRLGVRLEVARGLTWDQAVAKARNREIDIFAAAARTAERAEYMTFTRPYLSFPLVIVTRKDGPAVAGLADLEGNTVALNPALATYSRLLQEYPGVIPQRIQTALDGLMKVARNEADAYILNLPVAVHLIREHGLNSLHIAAQTEWGINELSMAARNDWPMLASILDKALASITPEERLAILNTWTPVQSAAQGFVRPVWLWLAAGAAIALLLLFVHRHRRLCALQEQHSALQRAEAQLRSLIDDGPVGVFRITLDGKVLYANQELARMAGFSSPEEAIDYNREHGNVWFVNPKEGQAVVELLLEQGKVYDFEYKARRKDGSVFWVSSNSRLLTDENGEPAAIDGFVQDISERKEAEQRTGESEVKFRRIFHAVADAVALCDMESGAILEVNRAWVNLYGYSFEEAAQLTLEDLEASPDASAAVWRQAMESGVESLDYTRQHANKFGKPFAVDMTLTSFSLKDRPLVCAVTRRKAAPNDASSLQYQLQLHATAAALETPANRALRACREKDCSAAEPAVEHISYIASSLRDLALAREHTLRLENAPVDMCSVLEQAAAFVRSAAPQHSVRTVCQAESAVFGDAARLQRMLAALGEIGAHHGEGELELRVNLAFKNAGRADVRLECRANGLFQEGAEEADSSQSPGLAAAKELALYMGGRMWLEKAAKGASGAACIALVLSAAGTTGAVTPAQDAASRLGRVLLVEDSEYNIFVVQSYVKNEPIHLDIAYNGLEGLDKFKSGDYDLVLMDMQMPVLDGYAATRAIRDWETSRGASPTPIVAVTAHAMSEDAKRCLEAGCTLHLPKPVKKGPFLEMLRSFLAPFSPLQPNAAALEPPRADIDPDLLEIAPRYLSSVGEKLQEIEHSLENNDMKSVHDAAHQLKGEGAAFGFHPITEMGAALQAAADAEDAAEARSLLTRLQSYIKTVVYT